MLCRMMPRKSKTGKVPVYLNVYDLTSMNGYAYWLGLGVYHSGVQGFFFFFLHVACCIYVFVNCYVFNCLIQLWVSFSVFNFMWVLLISLLDLILGPIVMLSFLN